MKHLILSILTVFTFGNTTFSQNVNIPDANFKAYLVANASINANADTEIQVSEAANYSGVIYCQNLSIADLTGIEAFVSLVELRCDDNLLTSLDLTYNTNLQGSLYFTNNAITTITLPPTSIVQLWGSFNPLTQIDVSGQTSLEMIRLIGCYTLTSLAVSSNTALTQLFLNGTSGLVSLDITTNVNLTGVYVGSSGISSLDISNNPSVNAVTVSNNNNFTTLNMANGNNMSFAPGNFNATSCPNLTCVEVDNVAFSNAVWNTDVDAGVTFSLDCSVVGGVLVSSISVQGQGGVSSLALADGTLQMEAVVLPANATDPSYTWTVQDATGSATIDANGLLTAVGIGDVTVGAIANDGSNAYGITTITITNDAPSTINENNLKLSIYPNPVTSQLKISTNEVIDHLVVTNLAGKVMFEITPINNIINVSLLPAGIYILKCSSKQGIAYSRFVKK
jgi:hypothetical protein